MGTVDMQGKIYEGPLVETPTLMVVSLDGKVAQTEAVFQSICRMDKPIERNFTNMTEEDQKPMIFVHDIDVNDAVQTRKLDKAASATKGAKAGKTGKLIKKAK